MSCVSSRPHRQHVPDLDAVISCCSGEAGSLGMHVHREDVGACKCTPHVFRWPAAPQVCTLNMPSTGIHLKQGVPTGGPKIRCRLVLRQHDQYARNCPSIMINSKQWESCRTHQLRSSVQTCLSPGGATEQDRHHSGRCTARPYPPCVTHSGLSTIIARL